MKTYSIDMCVLKFKVSHMKTYSIDMCVLKFKVSHMKTYSIDMYNKLKTYVQTYIH